MLYAILNLQTWIWLNSQCFPSFDLFSNSFSMSLAGFKVVGTKNLLTDTLPTLVSSSTAGETLLSVDFSKNPIDRSADQRLFVSAAPLEVIYDADTINKVVDFFKLPAGLRLNEYVHICFFFIIRPCLL